MSEQEKGFESLASYQHSLKLLKAVYKLAETLPAHEKYNLSDKIRRASISVLLNIAEGYGRYHYLDKLRFFYIARGSLAEVLSAFIVANSLGYVDNDQLDWVREVVAEAEKSLNGFITFIRKQQQGGSEYGTKYVRDDDADYHIQLNTSEINHPDS